MATIRKRGLKWQVQVRRDGIRPLSKSFIVKDDAIRWARQQEHAVDRGEFTTKKPAPSIPLADLLNRYETEITPTKRSFNSEKAHIRQIRRHPIALMTVKSITSQDIAKLRDDRLKTVAGPTVRKELNILAHLFKVANQEWGYQINVSACQLVVKPSNARPRDRRLMEGEYAKVFSQLMRCKNHLVRAIFCFSIATGMRRGETLSLKWSHIDWEARTARLDMTKNGDKRIVPLSPSALQVLEEMRFKEDGAGVPEGAVFPISANAFRLAWERAKKRAGVDGLRFHDLRHEAISRFFELGLSVPEVSLISGHKDVRMLFRYTHLKPENLAAKLREIG
jgi:integrase